MKISSEDFRVKPGRNVILRKWATSVKPVYKSKKEYRKLLEEHGEQLSSLQRLHYASNHYALLLIFQGMDAAGKDGAIRHVMSGVNPQGCEVFSFKQPSAEELEHDFLWRTTCRLPERGRIGIFNRSYYEEVLVLRVHPENLRNSHLPRELIDAKHFWKDRYRSIVEMEEHLHRNGTRVVKVFLHLSKNEQRKRFLLRIDEPDKNWKFSLSDIHERKYWKKYMEAYEDCFAATSTAEAPWYIVPADDKDSALLMVSQIVLDTFKELQMAYPKTTAKRLRELKSIHKLLRQRDSYANPTSRHSRVAPAPAQPFHRRSTPSKLSRRTLECLARLPWRRHGVEETRDPDICSHSGKKWTPKWTPEMEKHGKHRLHARVRLMVVNHGVAVSSSCDRELRKSDLHRS